ncbi:S-adenosyl-L-methionine-dependent methyltransferase [Mycena haematopus]|nr:S-adenosyl-L-methionine-dependent methyltransferase [Mycena haematopus]
MASVSTLRLLANLISQAVDTIEGIYATTNATPPPLNKPWDPKDPSEAKGLDPAVMEAKTILVAAAAQLVATVRDPMSTFLSISDGVPLLACLRTVSELNVVEILREAGPQGLHVKGIASLSKTDPELLARMLRYLATNHIFYEVAPDVFANNRISSALDKGKPSAVLFNKPEERLTGTATAAALVEMFGDEIMKSFGQFTETVLDPNGEQSPFKRALGVSSSESLFHWMMRPENRHRANRFNIAMHSDSQHLQFSKHDGKGFDWSQLPSGGVLVDVGCGLGSNSLTIAKKYPTLRVVNQDFGPVVEKGKVHWQENFPEHIKNNLIEFQAHDFFLPQPVKDADAFLLRHITHDWADEQTIQILRRLSDAAKPTTYLVLIEHIVPSVAEEPVSIKAIPGALRPTAPAPLLPNFGAASNAIYFRDLMMHSQGGKERTIANFVDVLDKAGWKLVRIHRIPGMEQCHIVGVHNRDSLRVSVQASAAPRSTT